MGLSLNFTRKNYKLGHLLNQSKRPTKVPLQDHFDEKAKKTAAQCQKNPKCALLACIVFLGNIVHDKK